MTALPQLIEQYFEYLEIEKDSSKLTIRDYRHYLETFIKWYSTNLPEQSIEKLSLDNVRKYRVFLANRTDRHGQNLKKVRKKWFRSDKEGFWSSSFGNCC